MDAEIRTEFDRLHDEEKRQNERIKILETNQNNITDLMLSVRELTLTSKYTAEKVTGIDSRLEKIEKEPAENVRSAKQTIINTVIGIVVGALVVGLFWLISNHGGI